MIRASFHFPLHRYLAAFICQAVSKMNMSIKDIIPSDDEHLLPQLMIHPLRVQVSSILSYFVNIMMILKNVQIRDRDIFFVRIRD